MATVPLTVSFTTPLALSTLTPVAPLPRSPGYAPGISTRGVLEPTPASTRLPAIPCELPIGADGVIAGFAPSASLVLSAHSAAGVEIGCSFSVGGRPDMAAIQDVGVVLASNKALLSLLFVARGRRSRVDRWTDYVMQTPVDPDIRLGSKSLCFRRRGRRSRRSLTTSSI
ncbi:hypothetical protein BV25DRAFT_780394 [Artomyces pyxidatus]|uniref:Uncharacterized protein n=1 Tax=Artomyces pyxidatus TaxID=48021 RepID=A0ACB8SY75_9AGAM|nr:hypothetical protein BV25DRAFT_780394 [Artomyces pyxidatus]